MWPLHVPFSKLLNVEAVEEDEDEVIDGWFSQEMGRQRIVSLSHFVAVPHKNQLHSWDCGLACAVVVLNAIGVNDCSIDASADMCCTTSIWTNDLASLLK
ncbi:unnamed protein product [Linum trigynum]|uniref:Guanylyl cyclase n=1 Tax=Linum trigynum TaxID=586398 RepID=A0AAV2DMY5_9ROSI